VLSGSAELFSASLASLIQGVLIARAIRQDLMVVRAIVQRECGGSLALTSIDLTRRDILPDVNCNADLIINLQDRQGARPRRAAEHPILP
jgi:hypothetical protein